MVAGKTTLTYSIRGVQKKYSHEFAFVEFYQQFLTPCQRQLGRRALQTLKNGKLIPKQSFKVWIYIHNTRAQCGVKPHAMPCGLWHQYSTHLPDAQTHLAGETTAPNIASNRSTYAQIHRIYPDISVRATSVWLWREPRHGCAPAGTDHLLLFRGAVCVVPFARSGNHQAEVVVSC